MESVVPITCRQCKVLGAISPAIFKAFPHLAHVDEVVDVQAIQMIRCILCHSTSLLNVSSSCFGSNISKRKGLL
jgi:hypothetical protein